MPMYERHTVLDLARWIGAPAVVVARPGLGTINHTLLTVDALRGVGVRVAGVVINRYPAENASVAEETNGRAIEKWGKVPVVCHVPDEALTGPALGGGVVAAIDAVDWERFAILRQ